MSRRAVIGILLTIGLAAARLGADVAPESIGQVARLPQPPNPHWTWVADLILGRSALIDVDDGRFLGMINGGYGTVMPLVPRTRPEIYLPATYYSRGTRGTRTDTLDIYDATTLAWQAEVALPPKRATNAVALAHAALSDDERFAAVFNWTTGTSLSIVDLASRSFVGEIATPGCSLVFAAGPRRFFSICADGSLFMVTLDESGREASRSVSPPFFDPKQDPVTEKAVRWGQQWLFPTFGGRIIPVDVSGAEPRIGEAWPLVDADLGAESWRIGGLQHLAVHRKNARLYALMHRGGPDTHKDPGEEVWIFDLASHRRLARVPLVNPGLTVYGFPLEFGRDWIWPFNHLSSWMVDSFAPAAVGFIQVTQDDAPLLLTASQFSGAIGVYDANDGRFLRRVMPTGWTSDVLVVPYGGEPAQ